MLVILTDMTNYCEALREVSTAAARSRAARATPATCTRTSHRSTSAPAASAGRAGTLTQLPILTMPGDDIGHPIPDLTGYITEGQIVLDRELDRRGIYPPVRVLPSLSRLMDAGIGEGLHATGPSRPRAPALRRVCPGTRVRVLASVMGEQGLPESDRRFLAFGDRFEKQFVRQENAQTLEESFEAGWGVLRELPPTELTRLSNAQIARHLGAATHA